MRQPKTDDQKKRKASLGDLWKLILLVIGIVAVVSELQKPAEERAWHGKVWDLVPYDFRKPTVERFKQVYWNPDGPILGGKAFGVGWAPNLGAVKRMLDGSAASSR